MSQTKATPKAAQHKLWRLGQLFWKLEPHQKVMYDFYKNNQRSLITTWNISRRMGKTHTCAIIAVEACLQSPNTIVKFVAPEQKQIRTTVLPIFRIIFEDAPEGLKYGKEITFSKQDNIFHFPNGSQIQLAGADNGNADSLRGGYANLCIIDEAGFVSDLTYVINSILIPTLFTTNGNMIVASTPPRQGDHEFVDQMQKSSETNTLLVMNIYDYYKIFEKAGKEPTRLPRTALDAAIQQAGGITAPEFRREFLCEVLTKREDKIIPEFDANSKEEIVVSQWTRPEHYDRYVSLDIGVRDLTVALFGYFDFLNNKLVIEDEFIINGEEMNTDKLAYGIMQKERSLFIDPKTEMLKDAYLRVSDNNLLVIQDLQARHRLNFIPTAKADKQGAINELRTRFANNEIVINERCTTLINHLEFGCWDKSGRSFKRSASGNHHCDAIDALLYMARNVAWAKNPFPKGYSFSHDTHFRSPKHKDPVSKMADFFKKQFTPKSSFKR